MKAVDFVSMCHIFLFSRGLQKNSLLTPFPTVIACSRICDSTNGKIVKENAKIKRVSTFYFCMVEKLKPDWAQ